MLDILEKLEKKHRELTDLLSDRGILSNKNRYKQVAKEHKDLSEIMELGSEYRRIIKHIEEDEKIKNDSEDQELVELAKSELEELYPQKKEFENKLKLLLLPKDPHDVRNTIMEIRAGTGGDEAGLFAADLYKMYFKYAESKGWRTEVLSSNPTGVGGFKEIIFLVEGNLAFGTLKCESGVHRVQRVPVTEASGRIHTSAASVAVLPEAEDVDVKINPEELRIDVFRSSGPGGQSVNTTDSAVRITHLPTNTVVTCQDEKSQLKNKNKALKVLRARLLDKAKVEQREKIARERKDMVKTGDRSEKIRTYNFPQGRVTDHRIGLTLYKLDDILAGDIDEFIEALKRQRREESLKEV
ncbi:MAG: peptide chain release factor 1 [candidate division Zixibacteria bacterium SM23_73_2]|nr:MAG: peptide chain release factor 1 [candidate division Zixibacteria bacterium SM23_73_2]